jgi:hypothetical protein
MQKRTCGAGTHPCRRGSNYFIHTQKQELYSQRNTRKLTLVGSMVPCRTNKVDLKETYIRKDLITHIDPMNCNLYYYFINMCTIIVFKNQIYSITMLNYVYVYLSSTRLSLLKRNSRYNQNLEITSNDCTNITIG